MAKEGKKLELYEILAAKKNKGKSPLGLGGKDGVTVKPDAPETPDGIMDRPGLIIDEAVTPEMGYKPVRDIKKEDALPESPMVEKAMPEPPAREGSSPESPRSAKPPGRQKSQPVIQEYREPQPEPPPLPKRPRSPREVVVSLETALFFFGVVLILLWTAYGVGHKRGQEERPVGLAESAGIEVMDRDALHIRSLGRELSTTVRPAENEYTLLIRKEPVVEDLLERLEMELYEAVALGRKQTGMDFPGFIYRTGGNDPHYILAVGLGENSTDPDLDRLTKIYNVMDNVRLSRQPRPYVGCRVARVGELGVQVL